jgi:arylsulfatase A-like enzyme
MALLRAQGCADVVLFTSDHGEAFWEHGVAEHGNGVWNEHLAVPLVLVAPGLASGTSSTLASLIDVPPTLASLAGIEPERGWGGVDLLAPARERSVLAFQCDLHGAPSSLALFAGEKKLLFEDAPDGEGLQLRAAFDLALDPEERHDRRAEAWAVELAGRRQRDIGAARQARVAASAAAPGDAALEELGHLGYGNR